VQQGHKDPKRQLKAGGGQEEQDHLKGLQPRWLHM
jgi:hypothetical protein